MEWLTMVKTQAELGRNGAPVAPKHGGAMRRRRVLIPSPSVLSGWAPGPQLSSSPSPLLAHIYALGVSAVSRWILMCFKEASPSPLLPSIHPSLPPSLSLTLLPASSVLLVRRGLGALRRARRSDSWRPPMAPIQRDCANQTTSPGSELP